MSLHAVLRNKLKDQKAASNQGAQKTKEKLHINPNNITISDKFQPDRNAQNKPLVENKPKSQWNDFGGEDDVENKKIEMLQKELNKPRLDAATEHYLKDDSVNEARKKARLESDESNKLIKILRKPEPTPYESTLMQSSSSRKEKEDDVPELEDLSSSRAHPQGSEHWRKNQNHQRNDPSHSYHQQSDRNREGYREGYYKKGDFKKKPRQGEEERYEPPKAHKYDDQRPNSSATERARNQKNSGESQFHNKEDNFKSQARENFDCHPSRAVAGGRNASKPAENETEPVKQVINSERARNFKEQEAAEEKPMPVKPVSQKEPAQSTTSARMPGPKDQAPTSNNKQSARENAISDSPLKIIKNQANEKPNDIEERGATKPLNESNSFARGSPEKGAQGENSLQGKDKSAPLEGAKEEDSIEGSKQSNKKEGHRDSDRRKKYEQGHEDKYEYGKPGKKGEKGWEGKGKHYDTRQYDSYEGEGQGYGTNYNERRQEHNDGKYEGKGEAKYEKKKEPEKYDLGGYNRREKNWKDSNYDQKYSGKYKEKNGGGQNARNFQGSTKQEKYGAGGRRGKPDAQGYGENYDGEGYDGYYDDYYDDGYYDDGYYESDYQRRGKYGGYQDYDKDVSKRPYSGEGQKYGGNKHSGKAKEENYDEHAKDRKKEREKIKDSAGEKGKKEKTSEAADLEHEKEALHRDEAKKYPEEQAARRNKDNEPEGEEGRRKKYSGHQSKGYGNNYDGYNDDDYYQKEYYDEGDYKTKRRKNYGKEGNKEYSGGGGGGAKGKQQVVYVPKKGE